MKLSVMKLIVVLIVVISSLFLAIYSRKYVPSPPTCKRDSFGNFHTKSDGICVDRARLLLNKLSDLGPKPLGSYANDVIVPQILLKELASIQDQLKNRTRLTFDQHKSDTYPAVTNIAARLFQNEWKVLAGMCFWISSLWQICISAVSTSIVMS